MSKRDQKFIHAPSGRRCRYFRKVRGSSELIDVLFLDDRGGFERVRRGELHSVEDFCAECVICENEGPHDTSDRPHVMAGQE